MSLPPLAPVSALEIRLGLTPGALSGTELARAEAALADASIVVRQAAGSTLVAEDGVTVTAPDGVVLIAVNAAKRAFNNPDAYGGEAMEGYSWQAGQGVPLTVYLSEDEVSLVQAAMASAAGAVRTLGMGTVRTPSVYDPPSGAPTDFDAWGPL